MLRLLTFLDEAGGVELTLPVTPSGYEWSTGRGVETIGLDQLGEINLAGLRRLSQATLSQCLLPARLYPFCNTGAVPDPWHYIGQLERWVEAGTVVRFLVSGTPVNVPVLVESVSYQEKDGTNDLYADITLRQYRTAKTPVLPVGGTASASAVSRDAKTGAAEDRRYTVARGDTLSAIARRFYGDAGQYTRLAAANPAIKNPNLIYPGQVLTIPAAGALPGAKPLPPSAATAAATESRYDPVTGKWTLAL